MRQLDLGRDEAEWLIDLLEDCDLNKEGSWRFTMARDIRNLFGMISMEAEREKKRAAQEAIHGS